MVGRIKRYLKNRIFSFYEERGNGFFFKTIGICPCCEQNVFFISRNPWLRDHFKCSNCGSIPRERALMQEIKERYPNWQNLDIHESSPGNRGHSILLKEKAKKYVQTHYFPKEIGGKMVNGYRNENLESQTFPNESFDLVITSDVMEHIYYPNKAFKEIHRTLKPGGAHIFSVPLVNKHRPTQQWATLGEDGEPKFLYEPDWHGNPIDEKGSPVTFHWGYDIKSYIEGCTDAETEIIYIDNLNYGIRAEYMEIIIAKKRI